MAENEPNVPQPDADKFPALQKLSWKARRKRIPYVQQVQWTDCGAACLAMVLGYYGRDVRLDQIHEVTGVDRDDNPRRG
jgi:hypothetical protein